MKHTWTVPAKYVDTRLDIFIAEKLADKTRSSIAKLLKSGAATVNKTPASVHRFLKEGDVISFNDELIKPLTKKTALKLPPLKIIEETPDWLVINKPTGLLVHPDRQNEYGTLIDLLVKHFPALAKVGEDPSRPGIVHRLDKDVSGLMVIAKTQAAFEHLKHQFAEHSVDKRYLALVHGELSHDEGDIKFRIARSKSRARMAARPEGEKEGKAAWTHYKVIQRYHGATLVELNILSGRTHQIRAHLHGLGYPIMGDTLYTLRQTDRNLKVPKLLLQSVDLAFNDIATGKRQRYSIPADPAFDLVIKTFKPHAPKEIPKE